MEFPCYLLNITTSAGTQAVLLCVMFFHEKDPISIFKNHQKDYSFSLGMEEENNIFLKTHPYLA